MAKEDVIEIVLVGQKCSQTSHIVEFHGNSSVVPWLELLWSVVKSAIVDALGAILRALADAIIGRNLPRFDQNH